MTPSWANSMILNYRSMFKKKYGYDSPINDDEVYRICNEIYVDDSTAAQDLARVEVMKERET